MDIGRGEFVLKNRGGGRSDHNVNILNKKFLEIGVGIQAGSGSEGMAHTVDFGTRL